MIAQNVTKYLGYFCKIFCDIQLLKIAQSGYNGCHLYKRGRPEVYRLL